MGKPQEYLFIICSMLVLAVIPAVGAQNETWCYSHITNPYFQFGTCTAYEDVYHKDTEPVVIQKCHPIQFWMLCRHGTRYLNEIPHTKMQSLTALQDKVIENHEVHHRGKLCTEDLKNLKNWNLQTVTSLSGTLTSQGREDLYNLAKRYKARFPSLLNQTYSSDQFQFRTTDTQRTAASAIAFADGLFGHGNSVKFPEPVNPDLLLKPYENCKKYKDSLPKLAWHVNDFNSCAHMVTLKENVSQRLGFTEIISIDDINAMYDGCRFHHAWHLNTTSPWCAVFTEDELQILEYREDLLNYYYNGYGNEICKELGCPPIKDFLDRLNEFVTCKRQPAGVFYFTHAEMIQKALLPLRIAMDKEPLTSCNYEQMKNRLWRTSKLIPFAANLVAVIFKCEDGEKYRIQFYLNEHLIILNGCQQDLCNWSTIICKYGHISRNCTLDGC